MHLGIVEPLRLLFKDEVRRVGRFARDLRAADRAPSLPGPGAIRILGDITPEKVGILQDVDKIYIDALRDAGLYDKVWQAGAILLPVKSVGVMGDERTYESCVALRAVTSTDGMTADWVHLPYEFPCQCRTTSSIKSKGSTASSTTSPRNRPQRSSGNRGMIPARPLCEQAAAVLQSLPNPLFGMACPDVYSPGRLLFVAGWCGRAALPAAATCV